MRRDRASERRSKERSRAGDRGLRLRSPPAHPLQDLEKQVAIPLAAKQSSPLVATRGDKVQVSGTVVTMESVGHARYLTWSPPLCM